MLSRRGGAAAVVAALALWGVPAASVVADDKDSGSVVCPPRNPDCELQAGNQRPGQDQGGSPGTKPAGNGGNGPQECKINGEKVPCSSDSFGTFNPADECYWKPLNPPPPPGDGRWRLAHGVPDGWQPGDPGGLYDVTCPGQGAIAGGIQFAENAPGGGVDLVALAQQATKKLPLKGSNIGIAPNPDGTGVVGMPVWIWNKGGTGHIGPVTASASAGGVTVTATAKVRKVVYSMGDGTSVTCTTKGTPYSAEYGKQDSPDCGHMYERASYDEPRSRYAVDATTTWDVTWSGAGQSGTITTTRTASTSVSIAEVQVVNTN